MRVKNRSISVVGYSIPDLHIRRRFVPGEVKDIPKEEIIRLRYQAGGDFLLANYLQIHKDDIKQLELGNQELEYYYSEDQVKELLLKGNLDAFLDALDFAPQGVIDLIKRYAVELPLNDLSKIDALKKKTGFDATKALANLKAIEQDGKTGTEEEAPARKRRVQEIETKEQPSTRRYNVID